MLARVLLSYKNFFFIENTKSNYYSASDLCEYTKYCFKENAKILSKNSTTQEKIKLSRKNLLSLLKTLKATSSASACWENTKSSFKGNTRVSSKTSTAQKNIRISKPKKTINLYKK